jgi:hypothetical protein
VADIDSADKGLGALWRDVLNFLGDREITLNDYLPLCDAVLPKWAKWPGYIGTAASWLASHRTEVEHSIECNLIGWRLWTERRELLRAYAQKILKRRVSDKELEVWWLDRARGELSVLDATTYGLGAKREKKLQAILELTEEEDRVLRFRPWHKTEKYGDGWIVAWLHNHLDWADDLDTLRQLARKTWAADVADRQGWTQDELEWVNGSYQEQQPVLMAPNEEGLVDPFELEILMDEQSLGYGAGPLTEIEIVFTRAAVVDFVDEILERSKRGNARGSLSCIECGRWVGRRALGYGQLYCSERCKKRVAKRRYRGRVAQKRAEPALVPLPPYEPAFIRQAREGVEA